MDYYEKYIKYKNKYLSLKNQFAGSVSAGESKTGESKTGESKTNQNEPINLNLLKKVPVEIYGEIIKLQSCKDIINFMITNKDTFQYNKDDWYKLIDRISIKDYQFNYERLGYPEQPQHPYVDLMEQAILCGDNIYCRLFTTKCLHKHLITKYEINDLKQCWYGAIFLNNTDDYQYFNKLVDTTTIGNSAFADNELTQVTIPNTVTTIGPAAFEENLLTEVIIGNSVTTIGDRAFSSNKLAEVTIPDSVTTIGDTAFAQNQLTEVTIGNSVTTIGIGAFARNQLTQLDIPNSVTTIDDSAFVGNQLTEVTIGNSVTTIGWHAFAHNQLTEVTIPNTVIELADNAFDRNVKKIIRN